MILFPCNSSEISIYVFPFAPLALSVVWISPLPLSDPQTARLSFKLLFSFGPFCFTSTTLGFWSQRGLALCFPICLFMIALWSVAVNSGDRFLF